MLGTRTKQVFSYGRRTQRIVSDDREPRTTSGSGSIFDDIPTSTWARAPVVSKMKKRQPVKVKVVSHSKMSEEESESSSSSSSESEASETESPPSPPVKLRIQRRPKPKPKRPSISTSPIAIAIAVPSKRVLVPKPKAQLKPEAGQRTGTRVSKLIQEDEDRTSPSHSPISKPKPTRKPTKNPTPTDTLTVTETPPRRPLSAFSLNVPAPVSSHTSPAAAAIPSKKPTAVAVKPTVNTKTRAAAKGVRGVRGSDVGVNVGKSLPCTPSFSPFVDVDIDIIVLDESGRKVSQERRVSRARDVEPIPIDLTRGRGAKTRAKGTAIEMSRGTKETTQRKTKTETKETAPAGASSANAIVLDTDTDEDEDEDEIQPKPTKRLGLARRAKVIRVDTSDDDEGDEGEVNNDEVVVEGVVNDDEGEGEDVELQLQPKPTKRLGLARRAKVIRVDTDDEGEEGDEEVVPTPKEQRQNTTRQRHSHREVEVVVPPVPPSYGVKHQPKAVPPAVPIPRAQPPQPTFPLPLPLPHHLPNPNLNHQLSTRYPYQHFDSPIAPRRQIQLTPIRRQSQSQSHSNPHSRSRLYPGSRLFPSASRDTPATPGNLDDGDEGDCSLSLEELELELELENLNLGLGLASPSSSSSSSSSSPSLYSPSSSSHPHQHQRHSNQHPHQPHPHPHQRTRTSQPPHLLPLLTECHQETCGPHEFSAFIETFPFDPIVHGGGGDGDGGDGEGGSGSDGASEGDSEGGSEDGSGREGGVGGTRSRNNVRFKKIGEASYSEVFGIGDVVLKVIPLRDEEAGADLRSSMGSGERMHRAHNHNHNHHHEPDTNHETDGPAPSDASDVLKEIIVTRAMGDLCGDGDGDGGGGGFVKLLRAYIVRGRYPEVLLELWDEYYERKGSESVRPDTFNVSQVYAIIVLPNGGPDLEAYTFSGSGSATKTKTQTTTKTNVNANAKTSNGWRQACSLFWQVTKALAHAEQLVSFEHRDLHWGQILVKNTPIETHTIPPEPLRTQNPNHKPRPRVPKRKMMMDDPGHGIKATLIDLGLSRMDAGDGRGGEVVHWTPFDEEVFMGEGDYQFDVYRMMREHNGGRWEEFRPFSNVMWLHYLAVKLLHYKRLKPPPLPKKTTNANSNANATTISANSYTEKECYECLLEIEGILGKEIAAKVRPPPAAAIKGKGGRRKTVPVHASEAIGLSCAGDVVGYGFKKGWVAPIS